jgi:hypothetical protein
MYNNDIDEEKQKFIDERIKEMKNNNIKIRKNRMIKKITQLIEVYNKDKDN